MKTLRYFKESLPIVAAALGKKCGLTVKVGGEVAYTDGAAITLPSIETKTEKEEREILGLLCHECAHVRFTDMERLQKSRNAFERSLDNALEDVRVEISMCYVYKGAEALFKAAHEEVVMGLVSEFKPNSAGLIPLYALAHCERLLMKREWIFPLEMMLHERIAKLYGRIFLRRLDTTLLDIKFAMNTGDVQTIRKKIIGLITKSMKEAKNSIGSIPLVAETVQKGEDSQIGTSRQCSTDGDSPSEEAKPVDNSNLKKEKSQFSVSGSILDEKEAKNARSSKTGTVRSRFGIGEDDLSGEVLLKNFTDLKESFHTEIENPLDLSERFRRLKATHPEEKPVVKPGAAPKPKEGNATLGRERLKLAHADSRGLREALTRLVQSTTFSGRTCSERGRRAAPKKLARLPLGETRVYLKKKDRHAPNTAIHVLLDLSGSMGVDNSELAIRASLGLIEGLKSIKGVSAALSVFPGLSCRLKGIPVVSIVGHGEPLSSVNPEHIGVLDSYGGTPLFEALQYATGDLENRSEKLKCVIVITDGPTPSENCFTLLARYRKTGMRFFGIQIGEDNDLKGLMEDSELVEDMADLKEVLFGFAKTILLGGKP